MRKNDKMTIVALALFTLVLLAILFVHSNAEGHNYKDWTCHAFAVGNDTCQVITTNKDKAKAEEEVKEQCELFCRSECVVDWCIRKVQ